MISGLSTQKNLVKAAVGVIILVVALGFVYFTVQGSNAKPSYTISGNKLTISDQYGVTVGLSGAAVSHEQGKVPATDTKTNGAAIGKIEKGYFKIGDSEVYLNVMDENASGYILITDRSGYKYYINCASPQETADLYQKISAQSGSAK